MAVRLTLRDVQGRTYTDVNIEFADCKATETVEDRGKNPMVATSAVPECEQPAAEEGLGCR